MGIDNFQKEKKYTYLKLLGRENKIDKLIVSSLLIGITHDLCKKDSQIFVNEKFIEKCTSNLIFMNDNNLDTMTKFDIIRNKLAHGDYCINGDNIKFNYFNKEYEVSIESIISFAREISHYYQYLNSNTECNNLIIYNGIVLKISDICKNGKRNRKYHKILEKYRRVYFDSNGKPNIGSQFEIENKHYKITYEVLAYTDKKDDYIENFEGNSLIYLFENYLSKNQNSELIDGFIDFYINYIYGLDTLLKSSDLSLFAFDSDEMFDFSLLNIDESSTEKNQIVGRVKQYDLNILYKKISELNEKINKLNMNSPGIEVLEEEIDKIVRILKNKSIQRLHNYANIRSEIEHIRCAIMHGNCVKKINSDTLSFFDTYKNKTVFKKEMKTDEFIEFTCNKKNNSEIEKHISKR